MNKPTGFETLCLTWGSDGTTLRRNGIAASSHKGIDGLSSDPKITALNIGGPGSGSSPRFTGDIAELRVYNRPLTEAERKQVEAELHATWFQRRRPEEAAHAILWPSCTPTCAHHAGHSGRSPTSVTGDWHPRCVRS